MSGYVVSPWLIYLISVCGFIRPILIIGGLALLVFSLYMVHVVFTDQIGHTPLGLNTEEVARAEKKLKIMGAAAVVILIIGCLLPSEETGYKMIAAHYLTYENIDAVGNSAKDAIDYLFEKVKEMEGE